MRCSEPGHRALVARGPVRLGGLAMSASSTCKIALRLLLYGFVAMVVWSLLHTYRVVRTERVNTRLNMHMASGEHEVVVAVPSGRYQIQFTSEPNVSPSIIVPARSILPALITTQVIRRDGGVIVAPTTKEHVTFAIEGSDAFRPQRLLVRITKTQECKIYMNLGPGF